MNTYTARTESYATLTLLSIPSRSAHDPIILLKVRLQAGISLLNQANPKLISNQSQIDRLKKKT